MKPADGAGVVADLQTSLYGAGFRPRATHKFRRLGEAPRCVLEELVHVHRDQEVPGLSQRTHFKPGTTGINALKRRRPVRDLFYPRTTGIKRPVRYWRSRFLHCTEHRSRQAGRAKRAGDGGYLTRMPLSLE